MSAPPATELDDAGRRRIIVGVLLAMLLAALDQTIVSPAIPTIGADLGNLAYLSWIVSAYFLTSTAVTPLYGKLADIHGRFATLMAAIGIFIAGSLICAMAQSMLVLVIGRAVQGIGGGGLVGLAQTVIADLVPPKERGRFAVYISGTWATASIGGPLLGGILTEYLHWSVIFWINLPLAAIAVLMTSRSLRQLPWHRREHALDYLGAGLVMTATVLLMLALTLGGAGQSWLSPPLLALFAGAVVVAGLFAVRLRTAAEPLIPLAVLANPVVLAATSSVFFAMAAFVGLAVFVPLYLELVLGLSTAAAGVALVGYMVGTVAGANFTARTMARQEHYKRPPMAGLAVAGLALAILAAGAGSLGFVAVEALLIVVGIGSGMQFPVTTVSVQNAVDIRDIGVATGVLSFLRSLGSALGIAVIGAIGGANGIGAELAPHGAGIAAPALLPGAAFTPVFAASAVALALALACLAMMDERPLRGRPAPGDPAAD